MTKSFTEVISGIRTAKKGVEVREDLAQMGEYCKQFSEEVGKSANAARDAAASSASAAKSSADNAAQTAATFEQTKKDAVSAVQQAQNTATQAVSAAEKTAVTEVGDAKTTALTEINASVKNARDAASEAASSKNAAASIASAAAGSAGSASASASGAATSAENAANSSTIAKAAETQSKFYSEAAQKAANASVQGYSGGYSRTLTLTAPQSGWKTLSSPVGIYHYSADVPIQDCTAKWNAFAAILPESYLTAYRARLANIVETYDGGVRLYAANAPDGGVKFTLSVFAVGSSTYYLTVPVDGWTAATDPVGSKQWQCDVELEDSSAQKVPMGMAALENTTEALSEPGLSATMETFDGYIRVYAKNKPTVPINIVVVLLARNEVN